MAIQRWRPNFKWNSRAAWVVVGIGVITAVIGLLDHDLRWVGGGCAIIIFALLAQRFQGHAKAGHPFLGTLEGDLAPIGDPPEEERVTVIEPADAPEQSPESAPPPE